MRKETSNQFTEGLVCDLNPINTPNTVLTDALNATVITYDGNEFSLQNDRGNYPLENCRLKPNYIPVGLKEYGDILYIVSYNPLNNHVEIGTYPSPMDIESSTDSNSEFELNSIIEQIQHGDSKKYSELVEKSKLHVWTSDNEEDSKLYPGDEYMINPIEKSLYKYEAVEFYIIDENRNKYNINDLVKLDGKYHPVAWQIPGWIAAQYRLGTFDDFITSIRSIEAPSLGEGEFDCKINLNFQLRISDYLFLPIYNSNIQSDLKIKVNFKTNDKIIYSKIVDLSKGKFIDWYSDAKILWIDYGDILKKVKHGEIITVEATPLIEIHVEDVVRTIEYDSFTDYISINLNSIGSYSDFNIGNEIWKFYVDKDSPQELYLEYDVTGPNVTTNTVSLYYKILDLDGEVLRDWTEMDDYNGITNQGYGRIGFDKDVPAEAIYFIEFAFGESNADLNESTPEKVIKKLVIASQIFSDFIGEYNNFSDIEFDKWIIKYQDSLTSDQWSVTKSANITNKVYQNYIWENGELVHSDTHKPVFESEILSKLWSSKAETNKGLVSKSELEKITQKSVEFISGKKGNVRLTVEHDMRALNGPLWDGTPKVNIEIQSEIGKTDRPLVKERDEINQSKRLLDNESIDVVLGNKKTYTHSIKTKDVQTVVGLEDIEEIPLMWVLTEAHTGGFWDEYFYGGVFDNGVLKYNNGEIDYIFGEALNKGNLLTDNAGVFIRNSVSDGILNILGDHQLGILGLHFKANGYKVSLQHGNTDILRVDEDNNSYLFTYLVVRQKENNSRAAVLVPIKNSELWKVKITKRYWSDQNNEARLNKLKAAVKPYFEKLKLCAINDALSLNDLLEINSLLEPVKLPVCSLNVYSDGFRSWKYKTKNNSEFDLLNLASRNLIIERHKESCGKLLSGSISEFTKRSFYNEPIYVDTDDTSYLQIDKNVEYINSLIKAPEYPNKLINKMQSQSYTKGVYWLNNGKDPDLISKLDSKFSQSEGTHLTLGYNAEVKVIKRNEADKISIAYIDSSLDASIE